MYIETDDFSGKGITGFNYHREHYIARVVIPKKDFEKLELGLWETYGILPPCQKWCHIEFGREVRRWKKIEKITNFTNSETAKVIFYFTDYNDALLFLLRWSI